MTLHRGNSHWTREQARRRTCSTRDSVTTRIVARLVVAATVAIRSLGNALSNIQVVA
jgi:hypothetical protein